MARRKKLGEFVSILDALERTYFVMVKPDYYFYSSKTSQTGYGLTSLKSQATPYTLTEAKSILKKHSHWNGIEIVEQV